MNEVEEHASTRPRGVVTAAQVVASDFALRAVDFTGRPAEGTLVNALVGAGLDNVQRDPPDRETLPERRPTWSFDFECQNGPYTCHVSYYDDGRVGEIWLVCGQPGSTADTLARDASLILSIAIQFGTPIDVLQRALGRSPNGDPAGPLGVVLDRLLGRPGGMVTAGLDPGEFSMPTAIHG